MKITNIPIRQTMTTANSTKVVESKPTSTPAVQADASAKSDNFVSINSKLASSSDIDMDKVNEISALLADGKLNLDLDILSDAIVEMHRR